MMMVMVNWRTIGIWATRSAEVEQERGGHYDNRMLSFHSVSLRQ